MTHANPLSITPRVLSRWLPCCILLCAIASAITPAADQPPTPPTPPAPASIDVATPRPPVLPRAEKPPVIDGDPTDACWEKACLIHNFTQISSTTLPVQPIEARLCFDNTALYIAITCGEKAPAHIRALIKEDHGDVWTDDCVELFLRAVGDSSEFDQFIVNTLSVQQTVRAHPKDSPTAKTSWTAKVKVSTDHWVCEIAIPWTNLGLEHAPYHGQQLEMKIGREDHAGGSIGGDGDKPTFANWPPNARYAHSEDYAAVYLLSTNLLQNADLTAPAPAAGGGRLFTAWNTDLKPDDAGAVAAAQEGTTALIRITNPGHYIALSQTVRTVPAALYRLHCEAKGDGGAYLRARVKMDPKDPGTRPLTVDLPPSADWTAYDLPVPGGADGEAMVILGTSEASPKGALLIRNLRLERESATPYQGDAIPVPVNQPEPFVIEVVNPTDARDLRGFIGAPIDGTSQSLGWDADFWEYNRPGAGQGVGYAYHNSDGLHITFADNLGVQAIQIHGGIKADVRADCKKYDDPASGTPVLTFPGHTQHSLAYLPKPIATDKLSFFHVSDGYIADLNCFRAGRQAATQAKALGTPAEFILIATAQPTPPEILPWIANRFPTGKNPVFPGIDGAHSIIDARITPVALAPDTAAHLTIGPLAVETSCTAIGLNGTLKDCAPGTLLQIQIQDPLAPRTAITTAVVALAGPGTLSLVLDIPDQVIPAGKTIWVTLTTPTAKLTITNATLTLYTTSREKAAPQSCAYHLLKLKGFYAAMSEARPWNGLYSKIKDVDAWIDGSKQFAVQLHEIKDAIEYCHALEPQNSIATQYYEWFYRFNKKPPLPAAILPDPATHPEYANAPAWAVAAHEAWLAARTVPAWWIANRSVPTGELGGEVGDDTDQFGNYADFPMFERTGTAAELLDCAERLAETAEQFNLENGLNKMTMDPLHAYEEGLNHEAQMVWWHYGDPVYFERCMVAAKSLESLTTVNAAGHRHFKNQDCGAADLHTDRPLGVDGFAHNQMLHPLFEVLWYNRNPRALKFVREWGDAWLAHQQPGSYAGMVDVKTDVALPDSISKVPYESGFGGQQSAFSFLYEVTGDVKYLAPVHDFLATTDNPGSWAHNLPELYNEGFLDDLPAAMPKLAASSPALAFLATGDKKPLIDALLRDVAEIQHFGHLYTTAEVFTDRVFLYPISNATVAYTGGYCTRNKFNHTHALSYEGFGTQYAALVRTARKDRVDVLLYNFADRPLTGKIRVWTLEHGTYAISQGVDADGDDKADAPVVNPAGQDGVPATSVTQELWRHAPIAVTLPSRQVVVLSIVQKTKRDPIEARADLALSPLEIKVAADGSVSGVAHNMGAVDIAMVVAVLVDAAGNEQARFNVGTLRAPVDLTPSRAPFKLAPKMALPADHKGWTVRLFTDWPNKDRAADLEIDVENNVVGVP